MKIIAPLGQYIWGAGGLWAIYGQLEYLKAEPIWIVRTIGGLYQQFAQPTWVEAMKLANISLSDHALLFLFTFVFSFPLFMPVRSFLANRFGEDAQITRRGVTIIWVLRGLLGAVVLADWGLVALRGAPAA